MWLAFYNPVGIGDVLVMTSGPLEDEFAVAESKANVTVICDERNNQAISVNVFGISQELGLEGNGQVWLTEDQATKVNEAVKAAGFDLELVFDNLPKLVVGHVESCQAHEDSDHLSVTTINVGNGRIEQIVCGARNIAKGLDVIVALPGAVMPNGQIIWPGELRGVRSNGMVCSTRELGLTDIEDLPGIWELSKGFQPGTPLSQVVAAYRA